MNVPVDSIKPARSSAVISLIIAILGLILIFPALLPEKTLSRVISSLSYSRKEISELSWLVPLVRVLFIAAGVLAASHAFPSIRRVWTEKILPLPFDRKICAYRPGHKDNAIFLSMTALVAFMIAPIIIGLSVQPDWLRLLLGEDSGYEFLTAFIYFASAGLIVVVLRNISTERHSPIWMRFACLTLLLMFLWIGLEEISYGQRIIDFKTPEALASLNQQKEFNLHNMATGFFNRVFSAGIIFAGIFLPVLGWLSPRVEYFWERINFPPPQSASVLSFAFAIIFLTPRHFIVGAFDEQRILAFMVFALLLLTAAHNLRLSWDFRANYAFIIFVATLIVLRIVLASLETSYPTPNYPEEFKEWMFGVGFLLYANTLLKWSRTIQPSPQGAAD